MRHALRNYAYHALHPQVEHWHPLLAIYYLTYACQFRCPYCSDGQGRPYHELPDQRLAADDVLRLLCTLRRRCDHLVLTGGEPCNHPQLDEILRGLPQLAYDGVIFTTNGYDASRFLPQLNDAVHHLVFSIDTLDPAKADRWYGRGTGTLQHILHAIEQAAAFPGRRYEILISSVAMPNNLADLHQVYDFAVQRGFRFAVAPYLRGIRPHPQLFDNAAYRDFFERLLCEKRAGASINGTLRYLEYMRDLRPFDCRPSTVLACAPNGDVYYPCLELGHVPGNLLQTPDIDQLWQRGLAQFSPKPSCGTTCHSACTLGFALIFSHPWSIAEELLLSAKTRLKGWLGGAATSQRSGRDTAAERDGVS